jgi:hypothetical protein
MLGGPSAAPWWTIDVPWPQPFILVPASSRREPVGITATLLTKAGLTGWRANVVLEEVGVLDFAFVAQRVAIEIDGRAWHVDRDRFQHDRTRQNRLVAASWTVLRFTWEDVKYRLDTVLADISAAFARLDRQ